MPANTTPALAPTTTHVVAFYNLDGYGDDVVFVEGAPVEAVFEFTNFNDAFDAVLEFGDDYQASIIPAEAVPAPVIAALPA